MMEYEDEREAVLMMTEACNSNCIMCPMSSDARKRGNRLSEKEAEEEPVPESPEQSESAEGKTS